MPLAHCPLYRIHAKCNLQHSQQNCPMLHVSKTTTLSALSSLGEEDLVWALKGGYTDVVKCLIENGHASIEKKLENNWTPLMIACRFPNLAQLSVTTHPDLSQLNPDLSQLNPNLSQLNPNLSQLDPDYAGTGSRTWWQCWLKSTRV